MIAGISRPRSQHTYAGILVALLAASLAVGAAVLTGSDAGLLTERVERFSATASTRLGTVATWLPFGYAFGAGMVAAVNPCGLAMLPAYLGLYLGKGDSGGGAVPQRGQAIRALQVSGMMTAGFVALFGMTGLLLSAATGILAGVFPWIGLIIGALLVVVGGLMVSGVEFSFSFGQQLSDRAGQTALQGGAVGYLSYGLAYGLASLSCTLPIFLTVVGGSASAQSFLPAVSQFVLYALGMGTVITVLTLAMAAFKKSAMNRIRGLARYMKPLSAVLLLVAGAYIIYYWLTIGGLLSSII